MSFSYVIERVNGNRVHVLFEPAFAKVPLVAEAKSTEAPGSIVIKRHPSSEELVNLRNESIQADTHITPNIGVNSSVMGIQVGNIGKDTRRSYEDARLISLSSVQTIQENQPPSVDWYVSAHCIISHFAHTLPVGTSKTRTASIIPRVSSYSS